MKLTTHAITLTLILLASTGFVSFMQIAPVQAGEPAGDSIMILNCAGVIPSTPNCVDETLGPFESLVYDTDEDSLVDGGELVIVGRSPPVGEALSDQPNIRYRDTNNDNVWTIQPPPAPPEPIFYDQDGNLATTGDRIFLLGSPTTLTTNIKDDPLIKFWDINRDGLPNGIVKVTARLERVGGTNPNGTREDIDAIAIIYSYDPRVLQAMRTSYPTGPALPDQSRFSSAVRSHCQGSGGTPLDYAIPDDDDGLIQAGHLCNQAPPRTPDVGYGCDPLVNSGCPGVDTDGDGFGDEPLQNFDVVQVQFMVLSRANFTITQIQEVPGTPGTKIFDIDEFNQEGLALELVGVQFNNIDPNNQPPVASFTFTPAKPTHVQFVSFDARSSIDPNPGGIITLYDWDFDDNRTDSGPQVNHQFNKPGTYNVTLTVTDDGQLTNSTWKIVTVNMEPFVLTVTATPTSGRYPLSVNFIAVATGGITPHTYFWDYGDGTNSTRPGEVHKYETPGIFTATVTVKDNQTRTLQESRTITVIGAILKIIVRDTAGSIVQGALVEITTAPEGQDIPATKTTGTDGSVLFEYLLAGTYTYKVTAEGFNPIDPQTADIVIGETTEKTVNLSSTTGGTSPLPVDPIYLGVGVAAILILLGVIVYARKRAPQRKPTTK